MDKHLSEYIDSKNLLAEKLRLPFIDKTAFTACHPMMEDVKAALLEQIDCDLKMLTQAKAALGKL